MIGITDLHNNICSETARQIKLNPNLTTIKFFIYIDEISFHELLRELNSSMYKDVTDQIWNEKDLTFMGHKIFRVISKNFHFNLVKML